MHRQDFTKAINAKKLTFFQYFTCKTVLIIALEHWKIIHIKCISYALSYFVVWHLITLTEGC